MAHFKSIRLQKHITTFFTILVCLAVIGGCDYISRVFSKDEQAVKDAYMEYRDALQAGDVESLKNLIVKDKTGELEGNDASQKLKLIKAFSPSDITVIKTSISENRAVLSAQAETEDGIINGEVHFVKEDGRWKLFEEKWNMDIQPKPIALKGGENAPSFEPIDAALISPGQFYGLGRGETFHKEVLLTPQLTLKGHEGDVTELAFTPDGQYLISSSYNDFSIRVWNMADGNEVYKVISRYRITGMDITPDGTTLITNDANRYMSFWPIDSNKIGEPQIIRAEVGHLGSVAISPNGKLFAIGSLDKSVAIGRVAEKNFIIKIDTPEAMRSVAFSPSGALLAASSTTNKFTLWNLREGKGRTYTISKAAKNSDVRSIEFSPDGKYLATGHMDSTITIWDVPDQKELHNFYVPNAATWAIKFSHDGKILATAQQDKFLYLWDTQTLKKIASLSGHTAPPKSLAFSPDGRTLASGGEDNTILIWR